MRQVDGKNKFGGNEWANDCSKKPEIFEWPRPISSAMQNNSHGYVVRYVFTQFQYRSILPSLICFFFFFVVLCYCNSSAGVPWRQTILFVSIWNTIKKWSHKRLPESAARSLEVAFVSHDFNCVRASRACSTRMVDFETICIAFVWENVTKS